MQTHSPFPSPLPPFKIIVGLGNPGVKHEGTYHNVGLDTARALCEAFPKRPAPAHRETLFESFVTDGYCVIIPRTYMNESGEAVSAGLRYARRMPGFKRLMKDALLVIHDDSDIPLGRAKLAFGRGAAGHRGVESVIRALGTKEFWRLRIGIRTTRGKAGAFVLRRISLQDKAKIQLIISKFAEKLIEKP